MRRVATGEPEARTVLVTRLLPRARRLSLALLRQPADADDAAQSGLIAVLESAARYRGEGSVERWADRIVARAALRVARGRSTSMTEGEEDDLAAPEDASAAGLADDAPRHVSEYLDALPEALRTVLVLRHVLDYSVDEIGDETGVSPNTVKDRLLRARERVRRMIRRDRAIGAPQRRSGT